MLPKKISDLLDARKPQALCDACIAGALHVPLARVRAVTEAFGITHDFTRVAAHCPSCGEQGWVTRASGTR